MTKRRAGPRDDCAFVRLIRTSKGKKINMYIYVGAEKHPIVKDRIKKTGCFSVWIRSRRAELTL